MGYGTRVAKLQWSVAAAALALVVLGSVLAAPSSSAAPSEERWAVLVGVDDYAGGTHDTYGSVGDVRDLRQSLVDAGWPESNIVELTDRYASAASIRDALRWLASRASATSLSVFHYSGHVKQLDGDRDGDGEVVDEFLWGSDNQFIADGELADALRHVPGRLWVDIAGCEAAGFDDRLSGPKVLFTASSGESEKSYERPDWHNSVFTGLLVDQGMLQHRAPADADGRISIQSAFAYAAQRAPDMTGGQSAGPQHPVIAGGDDQSWYLAAPPSAPPRRACVAGVCLPG
jgi:hypothetical protein